MPTLADLILRFYSDVAFTGQLPDGIHIMNPFRESEDIRMICSTFYHKYYNDTNPRVLILGINPGRLGAGATGIPFTDTRRLHEDCGITYTGFDTHEPSSVFIYKMIHAFGGPEAFYSRFYINSVCPLGFVKHTGNKAVNYNYYDSKPLERAVRGFIVDNIRTQIELSMQRDFCLCLGTGKNYSFLRQLNEEYHFFNEIIPLEHPRYIMQYKHAELQTYIDTYLNVLQRTAVQL